MPALLKVTCKTADDPMSDYSEVMTYDAALGRFPAFAPLVSSPDFCYLQFVADLTSITLEHVYGSEEPDPAEEVARQFHEDAERQRTTRLQVDDEVPF